MSGFAADTSMMLTTYKASAQDVDGYTRDLLALASLRHKNIASCIAVSAEKHPYCTLSEYYPQVSKASYRYSCLPRTRSLVKVFFVAVDA